MKLFFALAASLLLSAVPLKAPFATTPPQILAGIDALLVSCSVNAENPQADERHAEHLLTLFKRSAAYWTEATTLRNRVFSIKTSAEFDEFSKTSKRHLNVNCQLIVLDKKFLEETLPKRIAIVRFTFRKTITRSVDETDPPPDQIFPLVLSSWPDEIYTEAFRTTFHEMISRTGFSVLPYMYPNR